MVDRKSSRPQDLRRCVHVIVRGKVQGVWYRASAAREATRRALTGWVRNCDTGEVEAVVCGRASAVDDWVAWCHDGPLMAEVAAVDVTAIEPSEQLASFLVRGNVPAPSQDA